MEKLGFLRHIWGLQQGYLFPSLSQDGDRLTVVRRTETSTCPAGFRCRHISRRISADILLESRNAYEVGLCG